MEIARKGNYFKYSDARKDNIILAFNPDVEFDSSFKTMQAIQDHTNNTNICGMQRTEDRKELKQFYEMSISENNMRVDIQKHFDKVFFSWFNIYGQILKSIMIQFDFDNSTVMIGNKILKVETNSEYVYKIMKTKIKAINGIKGLYKFIVESMHVDSPFNTTTYSRFAKAGGIEK